MNIGEQLLERLPALFGEDVQARATTVAFLAAFEKILLGGDHEIDGDAELAALRGGSVVDAPQAPAVPDFLGIEEAIAELWKCFTPSPPTGALDPDAPAPDAVDRPRNFQARTDFLPWLAQWLALPWRADLPPSAARGFISQLSQIYARRGSLDSLTRILTAYTGIAPSISLKDDEPLCFIVSLDVSKLVIGQEQDEVTRIIAIARELIEQEKPAHARYIFLPDFPTFRVAGGGTPLDARVGLTTRLGVTRST